LTIVCIKKNVTSVYNYLLSADHNFIADHTNIIWHKEISLKGSLFAWYLLHNRILTTYNLVLQPNLQLSASGCSNQEDVDHPFLSCEFFGKIWIGISSWLGISTVHLAHVIDHVMQFISLCGFLKNICSVFHLI